MLYRTFSTQQEIDQEYNPRLIVDNFELKVDSVNNELGIIFLKVKANKKSSERASSRLTVLRGKVICKKL